MNKIIAGIVAISILSSFFIRPEKGQDTFSQLCNLQGTWMMQTSEGIVGESWKKVNGNTLKCKGFIVKNGDTVNTENVQLVRNPKGIFYIPTVKNQNNNQPVTFHLTSSANDEFIFENPTHDFPRRIGYHLISKDSLIAWIDGGRDRPVPEGYSDIKKPAK